MTAQDRDRISVLLGGVSLVVLVVAFYYSFLVAPVEASMSIRSANASSDLGRSSAPLRSRLLENMDVLLPLAAGCAGPRLLQALPPRRIGVARAALAHSKW